MVDTETIEQEGLTTEDVLDSEVVEPQQGVEWLPEWDEYPEERPGENTRIEDDTLIWEREGGFEARLESYEMTHWKAEVTIPESVGEYYPREFDLKCHPRPEYGFVKDVEQEDYATVGATLILQENFQPVWEVNKFIDELAEEAEESQEFREDLEEKLSVARENEERMKEQRTPGWSDELEAFVCPHCKEARKHVTERDDGGFNCVSCEEPIDDWVAPVENHDLAVADENEE